jgi:hypothetical protein
VEMLYSRDNRWALGRGVRGMHCAACDAELILTNVVPENTVAVRGFEHHTFSCSGCHSTGAASSLHETWAGGGPKAPSKSVRPCDGAGTRVLGRGECTVFHVALFSAK